MWLSNDDDDSPQCPECGEMVADFGDKCEECLQDAAEWRFDEEMDAMSKRMREFGGEAQEPPELSGKGWSLEFDKP